MSTPYPIVQRAELGPAQCLFTKSHEGPFIDMLRDFDFDHAGRMYVQVQFAKQLGQMAGLVPREQLHVAQERVEALEGEIQTLTAQLVEMRRRFDAVDLLQKDGFEAHMTTAQGGD